MLLEMALRLCYILHDNNFPIDDPEFQDSRLAFKFIPPNIAKQYGLDSPHEAIDKFKKDVKW